MDLATRLAIDPQALRNMLILLENKGRVRRVMDNSVCGSCTKCDPADDEIYEWVLR
jgi:putative ferrous iron transport protein C